MNRRHMAMALFVPLAGACSAGRSPSAVGAGGSRADAGPSSGGMPMFASGTGGNVTGAGGGATGGAAGSASAGGAGPVTRDPAAFSWPEANPDGSTVSLCRAGHYVGTYSCDLKLNDAGLFQMTGPVDITLQESQNGEFLTVTGGTMKSAAGLLTADGTVTGTLSCQSGAFIGHVDDGTLSIPPFPPGGSFTGTLNAQFAAGGPKLEGTWAMAGGGPFAGYACNGPWSATWQAM